MTRPWRIAAGWLLIALAPQCWSFEFNNTKYASPVTTFQGEIHLQPGDSIFSTAFAEAAGFWTGSTIFTVNVAQAIADPCANRPGIGDDLNGIAFTPDVCGNAYGTNVLGVTLLIFSLEGQTKETDIVFNSAESWDVYDGALLPNPQPVDFRRVAVHEIGHALGLAHEEDVPAIMQALVDDVIVTPQADDINGILSLYGKDDIVIDFGAIGLWARMNDAAWFKLNNASPDQVVIGDVNGNGTSDIIAYFPPPIGGIFVRRDLGSWQQLHNFQPEGMATGDLDANGRDDIVIDFGAIGLWARMNDATWLKLHNSSPNRFTIGDMDGNGQDDVIAEFSPAFAGLFVKRNLGGWSQIHGATPELLASADLDADIRDDIVVDFGGLGLWARMNDTSWLKLHNGSPTAILAGDLDGNNEDDVVAAFGDSFGGLWVRPNPGGSSPGGWQSLSASIPARMAIGDIDATTRQEDLIADFSGTVGGVFIRRNYSTTNPGSWTKLHNFGTGALATGDLDTN